MIPQRHALLFYPMFAGVHIPQILALWKNFRQKASIFLSFRVKLCSRYPTTQSLIDEKEKQIMSSKSSNKLNVPEARAAMDKFKMEAASEVDVPSSY